MTITNSQDDVLAQETVGELHVGEEVIIETEIELPPMDELNGGDTITFHLDPYSVLGEINEPNNLSSFNFFLGMLTPPDPPSLTGSPITVDDYAYRANAVGMHPKVAYGDGNYIIVWASQDVSAYNPYNAYNHVLKYKIISENGYEVGPYILTDVPGKYDFQIAYGDNIFLVVWSRLVEEPGLIPTQDPICAVECARVMPFFGVLDTSPIIVEDQDAYHWTRSFSHESPDVIFDGTQFLVIYRTEYNEWVLEPSLANYEPIKYSGVYARQVYWDGTVSVGEAQILDYKYDAFSTSFEPYANGRQRLEYKGDGRAILVFEGR